MDNYQFKRLRALLEREMQSMSLEQLRIIENMAYSEQIEAQERFKEECPPVLKPKEEYPPAIKLHWDRPTLEEFFSSNKGYKKFDQ